jgi:peptidoglycan glycosyltransferase
MNRQIRRLAVFVVFCFVALFVKLNQIQLIDAPDLNARPDNTRQIERDFNRPRGTISTIDGVVVARSEPTRGRFAYQREYPTHDLFAHVVGSFSYLFGADGVEKVYNDQLAGQTPELQLRKFSNPFRDHSDVGNVVLSLRNDVQETAKAALGDRKGSVVALDPRTGGILGMWSTPSYDPNFTSSNDAEIARAFREQLDASPDKPRLAKSYRDRFAPGSTFKVVTASSGVDSGKVTNEAPSYPRASSYTPPLTTRPIRNFDGATCGGTLPDILRVSCNSAFAEMGAETLGPDLMIGEAEDYGFNDIPPIDLTRPVASVFPTDYGARVSEGKTPDSAPIYENSAALAQASIGQYSVSATPLQMALVAAGVANRGTVMVPHVMDRIVDSEGSAVETYEAEVWKRATDPSTADVVRQDMIGVAENGTATAIRISGVEIGAKTGTAQLGTEVPRSHAWIIAFAGPPGQPPEVAVAVIVEGQPGASEQTGGRVAAPIARSVIQTVLRA